MKRMVKRLYTLRVVKTCWQLFKLCVPWAVVSTLRTTRRWHHCIVSLLSNVNGLEVYWHFNLRVDLLAATEKNEIDAVRCLCLAGLDLGITNKDGQTAEELAIGLKHVNIANLLSSLRRVSHCFACFTFVCIDQFSSYLSTIIQKRTNLLLNNDQRFSRLKGFNRIRCAAMNMSPWSRGNKSLLLMNRQLKI